MVCEMLIRDSGRGEDFGVSLFVSAGAELSEDVVDVDSVGLWLLNGPPEDEGGGADAVRLSCLTFGAVYDEETDEAARKPPFCPLYMLLDWLVSR